MTPNNDFASYYNDPKDRKANLGKEIAFKEKAKHRHGLIRYYNESL